MTKLIAPGSWVQIKQVVLSPKERAEQIPEETRKCPLTLLVKGFLQKEAELGEEVKVTTIIGRQISGQLVGVNPSYEHSFGKQIPELLQVGKQMRTLAQKGKRP